MMSKSEEFHSSEDEIYIASSNIIPQRERMRQSQLVHWCIVLLHDFLRMGLKAWQCRLRLHGYRAIGIKAGWSLERQIRRTAGRAQKEGVWDMKWALVTYRGGGRAYSFETSSFFSVQTICEECGMRKRGCKEEPYRKWIFTLYPQHCDFHWA